MRILLRAALGFTIAFAVYSPHGFATYFGTPAMVQVKAELAAAHPADKLRDAIGGALRQPLAKMND